VLQGPVGGQVITYTKPNEKSVIWSLTSALCDLIHIYMYIYTAALHILYYMQCRSAVVVTT